MTRVFPILTATATAAFLTFGGAAAFAAAVGGGGGHPSGPPGGPSGATGGPGGAPRLVAGCDYRADQQGLEGPERRAFLWRCQQGAS